ncbi:DUF7835 family putative zinc beta-ribbon protein [Natronococcus occultus]|uniref:DUF7835 domain-containing protein n=1 Tax=Natronococcus occultus SP4 TaxID=694430 RepID=L0K0M5_9EURY|nr:hypothetical protein [Natronococcus occultus]AGB38827.1 hypothetical protein Natoc_3084 [Natronococcus occultus SP4]
MATTEDSIDGLTEDCPQCGRETLHSVSIQLRTESETGQNTACSREPYRVSECQVCHTRESQRMNNA